MSVYGGIGRWAATFTCSGEVDEGAVVKLSGSGTVSACAAGEKFGGVVISAARDKAACAVALGGLVTVGYTGAAPAAGWTALTADGSGGVKTAGESDAVREVLVVDADTAAQTVTFAL